VVLAMLSTSSRGVLIGLAATLVLGLDGVKPATNQKET